MKKLLIKYLFYIFCVHLVFNLENYIFINEIFALVGFSFFIKHAYRYLKPTQTLFNHLLIFFLIYGFLYVVISYLFLKDGTTYQYIRTIPLWYSTFSFFLGFEFYKILYNGKIRFHLSYLIGLLAVVFGGRLSNQVLFPLLFYKRKRSSLLVFLYLLGITIYKGGSTSYAILFIYLLFLIFKNKKKIILFILNKYIIVFLIVIGLYVLYLIYNTFSDFYNVVGTSITFDALGVGEDADENALWRLMFWAYIFYNEIIEKPLFGIGFGTKLYDRNLNNTYFLTRVNPIDPNLEYTIGTHNSYFYILTRMGFVGFIPFIATNVILLKKYFNEINKNDKLLTAVFICFLFISVSALFNVILESPLYASVFWIICGMLYQGIKMNKMKI